VFLLLITTETGRFTGLAHKGKVAPVFKLIKHCVMTCREMEIYLYQIDLY
jgi:hypothetical protein